MEKVYEPIGWENFPSKKTRINATNLNRMDVALNALDNRIIEVNQKNAPVNNLLATVPGSPLDAVMGKMLNDMIVALEERFRWKTPTVPEPILQEDGYTRTYEIDLSSYTEVEIYLFIKRYSQLSSYRCCLPGGDSDNYIYFMDEYTDHNNFVWATRMRVYKSKIEVATLSNSTNPSANPIVISGIRAR